MQDNNNGSAASSVADGCPTVETAPSQPTAGRPLCLLVVDDSPFVRQRMVELIQEDLPGFEIVSAANGAEAKRLFLHHRPGVVMLDIHLPDVNGVELLKLFKATAPACMVLILTTYAFPELRERCTALGAAHFFDKATEFERVTEVLRDFQIAT